MSEAEKFKQWSEQYKTGVYMQWVCLSFDRIAKETADKHINKWNEIKAKEKFDNSLYGKLHNTMLNYRNEYMRQLLSDNDFFKEQQWDKFKIGSTLKIRLPSDTLP